VFDFGEVKEEVENNKGLEKTAQIEHSMYSPLILIQ
jgi:hypothetical protein